MNPTLTRIAAAVKAALTPAPRYGLLAVSTSLVLLAGCANVPSGRDANRDANLSHESRIEPLLRVQGEMSAVERLYIDGREAYWRGDIDRARRAFSAALRLDDAHIDATNGMALVFAARGEYDQSLVLLHAALKRAPGNEMLSRNLERIEQDARAKGAVNTTRRVAAAVPTAPVPTLVQAPAQPSQPTPATPGPTWVQHAPNVYSLERSVPAPVVTAAAAPAADARDSAKSAAAEPMLAPSDAKALAPAEIPSVFLREPRPQVEANPTPTHELKTTARTLDEIPSVFLRTPASALPPSATPAKAAAVATAQIAPAAPPPEVLQAKFSPQPAVGPLPPQFVRVMLSNASGSKMQAAVGAKRLREHGVKGLQVNNYHGDTANQTVIFYREGFRQEAELVLDMLAMPPATHVTLVATRLIPADTDVRVVLGPNLRALPRVTRA